MIPGSDRYASASSLKPTDELKVGDIIGVVRVALNVGRYREAATIVFIDRDVVGVRFNAPRFDRPGEDYLALDMHDRGRSWQ